MRLDRLNGPKCLCYRVSFLTAIQFFSNRKLGNDTDKRTSIFSNPFKKGPVFNLIFRKLMGCVFRDDNIQVTRIRRTQRTRTEGAFFFYPYKRRVVQHTPPLTLSLSNNADVPYSGIARIGMG